MTFVFASLVELAMVGYKMRNEGNQTIKIKDLGKKRKVGSRLNWGVKDRILEGVGNAKFRTNFLV